MAADSSIWEVHWNGNQKHFTYTNAAAVAGLCAASRLAERLGDVEAQELYGEVAQTIRDGVLTHLVDPDTGVLMGNLEEMAAGEALDSAAVEAINWGLIAPDDPIATATLAAFNALRLGIERGYIRNDDGGWYDRQEWVFVNLRIATALRRMGRGAEADALVGWVVAQARENHDMIAELYTEVEADYAGAVPMAGYGAGALALATLESAPVMDVAGCISWETRIAPPDPDPDPESDAGVEVTSDAGGGEGDAAGGELDGVAISDVGAQSSGASARGGCSAGGLRNRGIEPSEWLLLLLLALCLCPRGAADRARVRARTR